MLSFIKKQKFFIVLFVLILSLVALQFISAPQAYAATPANGPNTPTGINQDWNMCLTTDQCKWQNPVGFTINNVGAWAEYIFNPKATLDASHLVFSDRGNNEEGWGYAHFIGGDFKTPYFTKHANDSYTSGGQLGYDLTNDAAAHDASKSPKDMCSLTYIEKGCIDPTTGKPLEISDDQWQQLKEIVESQGNANNSERDCGDDSTLSFITCPIFNMVNKSIGKLIGADGAGKGLLIDMFYIQPLSFSKNQTNDIGQDANPLYTAWDRMKNIALSVYVIIFLVVIFANSMSLGIDAYTIKKTLPRLMAAALLTQFSFLILSILIDLSNVIGIGLPSFILAQGPQTFTLNLHGLSGGLLGSVVAFLLALILVIMALFSLIVALITIVARQLVVFMLVITAPLAFACWVLPNTQTLFKKWWSNLWRILAMFPIATGIIAAAIMFSRVAGHQAGSSNIAQLTGALAPLIALAILPKTFKWGGDFVNAATGAAVGFAAGKWQSGKDKAKGMGKKGYGTARDRVALNAPESARFRNLISGGGFRNSSPKNVVRRGQNKARILGEYDKAAQYATGDQLEQLLGSNNKGMQMAAAGRMAKTGNLKGLSSGLLDGKIDKNTYEAAVKQYYGDFEKLPQMRKVAFNSQGQVERTSGGEVKVDQSFYDGLTAETLAGASAESKSHIMATGQPQIDRSVAEGIAANPNLSGKFSQGDIGKLEGITGVNISGAISGSGGGGNNDDIVNAINNLGSQQGDTSGAGTSGSHSTINTPPPAPGGTVQPIVINGPAAPASASSTDSNSDVVAELKRIGTKLDDIGGSPPTTAAPSPEPHHHDPSSGADSSHLSGSDNPLPPWLRK